MSTQEPNEGYAQKGTRGFQMGNPAGAGQRDLVQLPNNEIGVTRRKQEVMRLLLEGATFQQISDVVGLAKATIAGYLREPEFRAQLWELNSTLLGNLDLELAERYRSKAEIMDELAMIALKEMRTILQDPNAHIGIRAKMIDSVLDRTPEVSRTKKLDVTSRVFSMKAEDLLAAANAAREIEAKARMKEAEEAVVADNEQNLARE